VSLRSFILAFSTSIVIELKNYASWGIRRDKRTEETRGVFQARESAHNLLSLPLDLHFSGEKKYYA
jgi:hypothetical protein